MRRIVCGNVDGRARVLSDGRAPISHEFVSLPQHAASVMWATDGIPTAECVHEAAEVGTAAVPPLGGTRFLVVHFPPASVMFGPGFDPEAAQAEQLLHLRGLAERFELEAPGMHQTDSVDYDIVLDGSIWLELDDGIEVQMNAGDVAIQQSTRHAWRNKGDQGATLAFILIGTEAASRV